MDGEVLEPYNPYTLFLIFVLLLLASGRDSDQKLDFLGALLQATQTSVQSMRRGLETLQAGFRTVRPNT
ncbi:MAG: hypothetical protein H5T97_04235 [Firmicutes bacterium]|nr:hypothetical protein [Bacillota bacterium]